MENTSPVYTSVSIDGRVSLARVYDPHRIALIDLRTWPKVTPLEYRADYLLLERVVGLGDKEVLCVSCDRGK
jgi:hypothetical protein